MVVYRFLSLAASDPTFELELRIDSPTTHKDYGLNCSKLLQMFRTSYFGFELDKATVTKTALVLIEFEIRDWRWTRTKSLTIKIFPIHTTDVVIIHKNSNSSLVY